MAVNGYKIFDSDTHVGPSADILERYMSAADRDKLGEFAEFQRINRKTGHKTYNFNTRQYTRRLGDSEARPPKAGEYLTGFTAQHRQPPNVLVEDDPAERIKDLDIEGVDVNLLLPSGWFGVWTSQADLALENSMYSAYHHWMEDYCGPFPDRLTGVILCSGRDVEAAVSEIRQWGTSRWAMAVFAYAPYGQPLDHPDLEPIWAAGRRARPVHRAAHLHRSPSIRPRRAGHLGQPVAAAVGGPSMVRHAQHGLRNWVGGHGPLSRTSSRAMLEAGHGWLPFWIKRLDEHTHSIPTALPPLERLPSDYVSSGRYYQSIEMSEGEEVTKSVIDILGEDVLMYASDYPHSESWFPISVETVMGWTSIPESAKKKLFWDNAVRYYRRYGSA